MRILIVEDDFVSRRVLHKFLSAYGECDIAVNGHEAMTAFSLAQLEGKPYTLVCLDIMMPAMDGQQVLKALRTFEAQAGTPPEQETKVFMTTALDSPHDVVQAYYRGGCTGYLVKPIEKEKLLAALREYGLIA